MKSTKILKALGTVNTVDVIGEKPQAFTDMSSEMIKDCDCKWSVFNRDSLISRINTTKDFIIADDETIRIIKEADEYRKLSNGNFDIMTGGLNMMWKKALREGRLPDEGLIIQAKRERSMEIRENAIRVSGGSIDLGGIAKGFILDRLISEFRRSTNRSCLFNLGGTIYSSDPIEVSIRDPFTPANSAMPQRNVMRVKIENECVITSGSYEQEKEIDGRRYSHIIDPVTGYPSDTKLKSITLIGNRGSFLDAMATALFCMDLDSGIRLLEKKTAEAVYIFENGNVFISEGLRNRVTMEV